MLKWTTIPAVAVAGSLLACHPARIGAGPNRADRPIHVRASLDCPARQGELVRQPDVAGDGACGYVGADGRRVVLRLVALDGQAAGQALAAIEASLRHGMAPDVSSATTPLKGSADPDRVVVNLPGVHIEADDSGAHVRALGEDIAAKSGGGATIGGSWNGVANAIQAGRDKVEVRVGFTGRQAVDQTFLLQSDRPGPSGDRLIGYVARGSATGPLVVATIQASLADGRRRGVDLKDLKALVAANVL